MSKITLPPLPEPRVLGRETHFGGAKLPIYGYTAEQLQADREAAIRACAEVCRARVIGDHNREDAEAKRCEAAILALLPVKEPKE